jgi:hypothetical protein
MTNNETGRTEEQTIQDANEKSGVFNLKKKSAAPPDGKWVIISFGIFLPLFAIAVELTTRICSDSIYNPLPTIWHILLYAFISVGNAVILWGAKRSSPRGLSVLMIVNGFITGLSFWYFIQGLAIAPIGALAILFAIVFPPMFIIGLCALSPVLSIIASFQNHKYNLNDGAKNNSGSVKQKIGIAAAIMLMILIEISGALTISNMQIANKENTEKCAQALNWLRNWGNKDIILRRCYDQPTTGNGILTSLINLNDNMLTADARKVYYRIYGEKFQNTPSIVNSENSDLFSFGMLRDRDIVQKEDGIGRTIKGLSMETSIIDGSVDADAALAYMQWTMTLRNSTPFIREGKMQIALPPGAVVSRLTLWVNGEEREAAFAPRRLAQKAYEDIAYVQRRDPVLVTTCGPDRIQVQCFPVNPNGVMKIRLGITSPLLLDSASSGTLAMPYIIDKNFEIYDSLKRVTWLESKSIASSTVNGIKTEKTTSGVYALRGKNTENSFNGLPQLMRFERNSRIMSAWTPDSTSPKKAVIHETIKAENSSRLKRISIVIDGSACMKDSMKTISKAVGELPEGMEFSIFLAGDNVKTIVPLTISAPDTRVKAAVEIAKIKCVGGTDNIPAIISGWDAVNTASGAILWIHGPQPLIISDIAYLFQCWERRTEKPQLYSLDAVVGDNAIYRECDGNPNIHNVPRTGTLDKDITRVFSYMNGEERMVIKRARLMSANWTKRENSKETSKHLSRLWASDQTEKFNAVKNIESAIAVARKYQLVTSVTGAVVLENQQQYKDNGLDPVNAGTVPTVPEPEEWMLMIAAAVVLGYVMLKRKRVCAAY